MHAPSPLKESVVNTSKIQKMWTSSGQHQSCRSSRALSLSPGLSPVPQDQNPGCTKSHILKREQMNHVAPTAGSWAAAWQACYGTGKVVAVALIDIYIFQYPRDETHWLMTEKAFVTQINFTQVQDKHCCFLIIYHGFCMLKWTDPLDYKFPEGRYYMLCLPNSLPCPGPLLPLANLHKVIPLLGQPYLIPSVQWSEKPVYQVDLLIFK